MGCCGGDREKGLTVAEDQKWTYIVRTSRCDLKLRLGDAH
jgi:hypothetical protein